MATAQQMLSKYASGAITFDALLTDFASRTWTTRPASTSLEQMYATAEEYPGPNDTDWLNIASLTPDEYRQCWAAVRQSMATA